MDLSPGYRELPPPHALRDVVACFWMRVPGRVDEVRIVPDACSDVVWRQGQGVTVAGPDTTAKLVGVTAGDVLVGMRFLPGAGGVLGVPLDELRDQRVDVGEVDGAFALDGELEPAEVIARFAWAAAGREADPLVAAAARMVSARPIGDVAHELGISERQLRRRFHASVGYGPKTLARILRFRRFVEEIDGGRTDLAALAVDAGYADQAHLTTETTRLAGLPPARLIRARGARD